MAGKSITPLIGKNNNYILPLDAIDFQVYNAAHLCEIQYL